MNKKTYTAPEAEIEKFNNMISVITDSDPDASGGHEGNEDIIDF